MRHQALAGALALAITSSVFAQSMPALVDPCIECGKIYAGDCGNGLWVIDPVTMASSFIGAMPENMFDVAITSDGRLFGQTGGGRLYLLDACTGAGTLVGSTTGNGLAGDLASTDLLAQGPPLFRQDTAPVGAPILVGGAFGGGPPGWCGFSVGDLAMSPSDGLLYATLGCGGCSPADTLVQIDPVTGDAIAEIGCVMTSGGAPLGGSFGVAFDSACNLWASSGGASPTLLRIDIATGIADIVPISGGYSCAFGLASLPCVSGGTCTLVCPPDLVVAADPGACVAAVGFALPTGTGCDPAQITCDHAPGDVFPLGTTVVSCEAPSGCGGLARCSFSVSVEDREGPDVVCPPDVILECGDPTDPGATGMASATDVCGSVTVSFVDTLIASCGGEHIEREWTAIDDAGNSSSCVQIVDASDTTPPVVTCNASDVVVHRSSRAGSGSGSAGGGAAPSFTATATDACTTVDVEILDYQCTSASAGSASAAPASSGSAGLSACAATIDGDTITFTDTGAVGTTLSWRVLASDLCGNQVITVCEATVIAPTPVAPSPRGRGRR